MIPGMLIPGMCWNVTIKVSRRPINCTAADFPTRNSGGNQVECYKACQDHGPAIIKRDNLVLLYDSIVDVEEQELYLVT